MMTPIEVTLVLILVGGAFLHFVIELLNLSNVKTDLPQEFVGLYDSEKYRKSQEYLRENTVLDLIRTGVFTVALLAFIFLGGFGVVDFWARGFGYSEIGTGLIFVGALSLLGRLLSLPFSVYETFVIEEKYGFNRMTWKVFLVDLLKGVLLGAVLGGLILAGVIWFFQTLGEEGWLWAWSGLTAFQIILFFLAPIVILPLFNRFIPLEDGELKAAIETYANSQNFQIQGIFKMDGSKRSTKANAFFTGFGKYKRIVLFDTLVDKHSIEELVAVLAHEVGHFKKRHVFKQLFLSVVSSGLMFYVLSLFLGNRFVFDAFRVENVSIYGSIFFFGIFYSPFSRVISLLSLYLSRKYEFEADEFSVKTYHKPAAMISALKKLSVDSLSNLYPHWLKVFMDYTHPPVLQRIHRLEGRGV